MTQTFSSANAFRKCLETRLKNLSLKTNIDLQRLRKKVAFDRFLARIFSEPHSKFFLKGGYEKVYAPPHEWEGPFTELAIQCNLPYSLSEAFSIIRDLYQSIIVVREA